MLEISSGNQRLATQRKSVRGAQSQGHAGRAFFQQTVAPSNISELLFVSAKPIWRFDAADNNRRVNSRFSVPQRQGRGQSAPSDAFDDRANSWPPTILLETP